MPRNPQQPGKPSRQDRPDAGETRGAVALTVAWMLSAMATAMALLVVAVSRLLIIGFPAAVQRNHPLEAVSGTILLVAVTTGLVCLLVTPLVYRVRRTAPPRSITIGAALVGLAPLVAIAVLSLLNL